MDPPVPVEAALTREPIDPARVLAAVGAPEDGAVLLFLGTVRNHSEGRPVSSLHYEAYRGMAEEVLGELAREAMKELGSPRVAVVHRVGTLRVGEVSVAIAVSSPHREEAYRASRYLIEELKKRLPVWKKEGFADGEAWVEGTPVEGRTEGGGGEGS